MLELPSKVLVSFARSITCCRTDLPPISISILLERRVDAILAVMMMPCKFLSYVISWLDSFFSTHFKKSGNLLSWKNGSKSVPRIISAKLG
jgi:hypothetical protein